MTTTRMKYQNELGPQCSVCVHRAGDEDRLAVGPLLHCTARLLLWIDASSIHHMYVISGAPRNFFGTMASAGARAHVGLEW
jgi:hypothetical protein